MIIYKIQNKLSGKIYIGQTIRELKQRINVHLFSSGCPLIHNALKKYGIENFDISIIDDTATNRDELNTLEKKYILEYNCISPNGYNLYDGGINTVPNKEVREKISKNRKGRLHTEESKLKMSLAHMGERNPNYGKHFSEEHKRKISESNKGKICTEETRRRLSESHIGHIISEETRKKISENSRNISEETRRKMSEKAKGRIFSEEYRRKLSESQRGEKSFMFGKHLSEDVKRKISESLKATLARKRLERVDG